MTFLTNNGSVDESYSDDSLYNITSYGADLSVREIVTMFEEGDLIKPSLQRNYVWNKKEASRFIDSLLLGLPVPSVFLAKDTDEKLLIVDGFQRITTLFDYINGISSIDGSSFKLTKSMNINERWRGLSFNELPPEMQRRIKGYTIHSIIFEKKDKNGHDTAMYQIFERINTGGQVLSPQEIRNCVYHGEFNNLLIELSRFAQWKALIGRGFEKRMKDIEFVLRAFAIRDLFVENQKAYVFSKYLNEYMEKHRNLDSLQKSEFTESFVSAVTLANDILTSFKNREGMNWFTPRSPKMPLIEALIVSIMILKKTGQEYSFRNLALAPTLIKSLLEDHVFKETLLARTTNIDNIRERVIRCLFIVFGVDYEN